MLKFDQVSKKFSAKSSALHDITLEIADGEFVFLVGTSGAGKTTLLSLITRQLYPTSGTILFNDWDITALPKNKIPELRRKIGSIFQDYKLLMERTVEENVGLTLDVQGRHGQEVEQMVNEALNLVGLEGKNKFFPQELAGGEIQRVAIARAIVANPEMLLADEPTADLDPRNAWAIVKLLEKINETNKTTIIMATHNTDIVNQMKKRVVMLENGSIVSDEKEGKYITKEHPELSSGVIENVGEEEKKDDKKHASEREVQEKVS